MKFKAILNKISLYFKENIALLAVIISLVGVGIGVFNTFQIKNISYKTVKDVVTLESPEKILKELPKDALFLGNEDAKLTLIEFADYQCPYCGKFFKETFPQLKKEYIDTGKVKFVYLDFAFLGLESNDAAEAAKCSAEQGKFWEYHDELYRNQKGENQGNFNQSNLKRFAKNIGLNAEDFASCIEDTRYDKKIEEEEALGRKYGVKGTPGFLIGKQSINGAQSYASFKTAIDSQL